MTESVLQKSAGCCLVWRFRRLRHTVPAVNSRFGTAVEDPKLITYLITPPKHSPTPDYTTAPRRCHAVLVSDMDSFDLLVHTSIL